MTDRLGVRFELRPDGVAREVAGADRELLTDASTRRGQVTARVEELVAQYRGRHGREHGAAARKAMTQEVTLSTRAAKAGLAGLAGPAAVAAGPSGWPAVPRGWPAAVLEVDMAAMAAPDPVATDRELIAQAMAAGLAVVQSTYATWQLGNLADAIERHLGDADALGVPPRRVARDGRGHPCGRRPSSRWSGRTPVCPSSTRPHADPARPHSCATQGQGGPATAAAQTPEPDHEASITVG